MINVEELFDKYDEEYLEFERIEDPLHPRPDVCAFLLLHRLLPKNRDMVSAAEHDKIWLDVDPEALAEVATEEDIRTLVRCGVMYELKYDSLSMFV